MNRRIVPATGWGVFLRFYDPLVAVFARQAFCQRHMIEQVRDVFRQTAKEPIRILDVGCGTGTFASAVEATFTTEPGESPHVSVQALDADPRILAEAERKNSAMQHVRWILGDAVSIPIAEDSMDIVVSSLVFHHLTPSEKQQALSEIRRVLAPGGTLILLDYGQPQSILASWQFCLVRILDGWERTRCNARGQLPHLMHSTGFEVPAETLTAATLLGTIRCYRTRKLR